MSHGALLSCNCFAAGGAGARRDSSLCPAGLRHRSRLVTGFVLDNPRSSSQEPREGSSRRCTQPEMAATAGNQLLYDLFSPSHMPRVNHISSFKPWEEKAASQSQKGGARTQCTDIRAMGIPGTGQADTCVPKATAAHLHGCVDGPPAAVGKRWATAAAAGKSSTARAPAKPPGRSSHKDKTKDQPLAGKSSASSQPCKVHHFT